MSCSFFLLVPPGHQCVHVCICTHVHTCESILVSLEVFLYSFPFSLYSIVKWIFFKVFQYLFEREHWVRREKQRERGIETLHAVLSMEHDMALHLMTQITTWAKVKSGILNSLSHQASLNTFIFMLLSSSFFQCYLIKFSVHRIIKLFFFFKNQTILYQQQNVMNCFFIIWFLFRKL